MRWPDIGLWKGGDLGPGRNDLGSLDVLGLGDGEGLRGGTGFGGDLSRKNKSLHVGGRSDGIFSMRRLRAEKLNHTRWLTIRR
jgi:hypothetical protein